MNRTPILEAAAFYRYVSYKAVTYRAGHDAVRGRADSVDEAQTTRAFLGSIHADYLLGRLYHERTIISRFYQALDDYAEEE